MIRFRFYAFGSNSMEVMLSSVIILEGKRLPLVKVGSSRFLLCQVIAVFHCVINKYLVRDTWRLCTYPVSHQTH